LFNLLPFTPAWSIPSWLPYRNRIWTMISLRFLHGRRYS
jgi:hypothetical protein